MSYPQLRAVVDRARSTETLFAELLDFGFDHRQARALVDAGYVLRPGRFAQSRGVGVNAVPPGRSTSPVTPVAGRVAAPTPRHNGGGQ